MEFNSQICTTREQSERLIALGLKKETADMFWWDNEYGPCTVISRQAEKEDYEYGKVIPAWSLHRLMSMLTAKRKCLLVRVEADLYDVLIDRIEHEIKEGYFSKEYLQADSSREE